MSIDWKDPEVRTPALLTSPDPIERIIGKVYHTLRNNPENQKTGDELFVELARDHLQNKISRGLMNQFVGTLSNSDTEKEITEAIRSVINQYVSSIPYSIETDIEDDGAVTLKINFTLRD